MNNHKCNKCYHQAIVKCESGNKEYCLVLDIPIIELVKNCTEFTDSKLIQEPDYINPKLDEIIEFIKTKPTLNQVKRKIDKIKQSITLLRVWGRKNNKSKIRKK